MSPPRNPLPLLMLVIALVAYFLPWFEWTCVTKVTYSESFECGLQGLPEEMKPRQRYEQRYRIATTGVTVVGSDTTTNDEPHVMDQFTLALPALHFGPRYNLTSHLSFALGGGSLLIALLGCWRYRRLALFGCLGAVANVAVALATLPHLRKYLRSHTNAEQEIDVPGQFTMHYTMHYTTTPWFYVGTTSIVLALVFMLMFGRKKMGA